MAEEKTKEPDVNEKVALGISESNVTQFNNVKESLREKEKARHEKLKAKRIENRIAKKKAEAKLRPIDKRRNLLMARLGRVKGKQTEHHTPAGVLKEWIDELKMIKSAPKAWNERTQNGSRPFKVQKTGDTVQDKLNAMDLD